ncbi:hypothetical protein F510_2783 [Anoxybacillus gonensis]|nr:hypothetical protein F510_2783 [Anoxybacillus gonensis]
MKIHFERGVGSKKKSVVVKIEIELKHELLALLVVIVSHFV